MNLNILSPNHSLVLSLLIKAKPSTIAELRLRILNQGVTHTFEYWYNVVLRLRGKGYIRTNSLSPTRQGIKALQETQEFYTYILELNPPK